MAETRPPVKRQKTNVGEEHAKPTQVEQGPWPIATPLGARTCCPQAGSQPCSTAARQLHSLQRVFCSQSLTTPSRAESDLKGTSTSSKTATDLPADEFIIHCSQTFCYRPSGLVQDGECCATLEPDTTAAEQQQLADEAALGTELQPRHASCEHHIGDELDRRRCATPEMGSDTEEIDLTDPTQRSPAPPKLFPIFMQKSQRKVLHFIRHGQSEYNAASAARTGSFTDPQIFDAKLTALGCRQAEKARKELATKPLDNALWVCSPLQRAIETFLLCCPTAALFKLHDQTLSPLPKPPKLVFCSEVAEHVATTGDVGSTASVLRRRFPEVAHALVDLPERWWAGEADGNDAAARTFKCYETKDQLKKRIAAFSRWLATRPEKVVIVVGHSTFIRDFTKMRRRLANCEMTTVYI